MYSCADNVRGLKPFTEAWEGNFSCLGRGALCAGRSISVSRCGLHTSADAGISSAKTGENPVHRKPKVSAVKLVFCRSAGPKARAKAVVDGGTVYIPSPCVKAKLAGTLSVYFIWLLVCQFRKDE
jgi:hypothetical protein